MLTPECLSARHFDLIHSCVAIKREVVQDGSRVTYGNTRIIPAIISFFQFDVPIEIVPPCLVQVVWRECLAVLLQLPARGSDRLGKEAHMRILRCAPALFHIAWRASRNDVFPRGLAAHPARNHVVKGEVLPAPAILALEVITQKQIEACECGKLARLHILPQGDHARNLHIQRGRVHLAVIAGDNIHPVEEHRLDRRLPGPKAQGVIG